MSSNETRAACFPFVYNGRRTEAFLTEAQVTSLVVLASRIPGLAAERTAEADSCGWVSELATIANPNRNVKTTSTGKRMNVTIRFMTIQYRNRHLAMQEQIEPGKPPRREDYFLISETSARTRVVPVFLAACVSGPIQSTCPAVRSVGFSVPSDDLIVSWPGSIT